MPPDKFPAIITSQWIARADEDLALAEHLLDEKVSYYSAIAFHSQQAAEKYLKGILAHYRVAFPKTHDLAMLLDLLATCNKGAAGRLDDLTALTPFAIEARYPGDFPEVNPDDAAAAVALARQAGSEAHAIVKSSPRKKQG